MQIRIINPGLLSTVQDMGRRQYLSQAVSVSGAMDMVSARIANIAVGNAGDEAVIEFTYAAATFTAATDILIAYSGGGAVFKIDYNILLANRPVFIPAGKTVRLVNDASGSRTYLAIAGGWNVPVVLGSRSTCLVAALGGYQGRALQAGDVLDSLDQLSPISQRIFDALKCEQINQPKWTIAPLPGTSTRTIRVVPGMEFTWFNAPSIVNFLSAPYQLSMRSNRMGYHLEGPLMQRYSSKELLSTAVVPGTIQVTGNGGLVLLMADCQTTGGYPRIAQVAAVDMPLCGQLKPGDAINFKEISRQEAEILYLEQEQYLHQLTWAVQSKF